MNPAQAPHVFISYSHDSQAHKDWVRHLAEKLQRNGVETILDKWDLRLGGDLPSFMEQGLAKATRILVVCTDTYVKKANAGDGGTGYEKMILTGRVMKNIASNCVIPVVRQSSGESGVPDFLISRIFTDFSDDNRFEENFDVLLREIYGKQRHQKPELGSNPFESDQPYVKPTLGQAPAYIQSLSSRPEWADDAGEDKYGSWANLKLAGVNQRMRRITPGSFLMGSPGNEKRREDDEIQHRVSLTKGFWLADTACTQELWRAVMGDNPSDFSDNPQNPVENISWNNTQQFCHRANDLLDGFQLRLATEAQWEYACRAGTETPFSFGEQITTKQANYDGNYPYDGGAKGEYREQTVPVSQFEPNRWGLFQMHGNVWEWCQDWYGDYPHQAAVDPKGPDKCEYRVLRGGSWFSLAVLLRCARRSLGRPDFRDRLTGLRLAGG